MRARPFLAVVLAVVLLAAGLGAAGWWLVWRRSPLQLAHHPLVVPRAARFVPRLAPLSLYLFTDGEQPVGYARAVAPTRQRVQASEAIERLRDGAFAAAGLDYRNELAGWLAPEIGLALFETAPAADLSAAATAPPPQGWLLALASRDSDGARRFLQRFWQTRSLAGTDLQVSSYRGMGLISGRGALLGKTPVPLATALVNDDLVLIASGRGVLEQALDVSQIEDLNQALLPGLGRSLEEFGEGAALLLARPMALERWLGLPLPAAPGDGPTLLTAVLEPEGRNLRLRGRLDRQADAASGSGSEAPATAATTAAATASATTVAAATADPALQRQLLSALRGHPSSVALLQNPAALLGSDLLRPLILRAATGGAAANGPLPELVARAAAGPLLAADGPDGWLQGTSAAQPSPEALEPALAAEGLIPAPLELPDRTVLVWTKLEAGSARGSRRSEPAGEQQLQATVAGWRSVGEDGTAWWGRNLALLDEHGPGRIAQQRQRQLAALPLPLAPLQWALGREPALALLQGWQPWRLLSALAGGGLGGSVEGLALAVQPDAQALQLAAQLDLSPQFR